MANRKKSEPVKITAANNGMIEAILDDAEFNRLVNRLTTIINFSNGANEALRNLRVQLASICIN